MKKPGTLVGKRYRCRYLLAEGGMAEVYLSERFLPNGEIELCALKRLLPHLKNNPIFADMFAYEALLSSSFSHKNIVRCQEFFRDDGDLYMALEFILGKEVGALALLAKTWQPAERLKLAVAVGLQIIDALSYIHNYHDQSGIKGPVVHGDISPQNIMVTIEGAIKLYDFGAAQTGFSSLSFVENVVRGHPRYMSPEHMAGQIIGPKSDLYSLSLTLIEIIVADTRFDRNDPLMVEKLKRFVDTLNFNAATRKLVYLLCERGLASNADERFLNSDDLSDCLYALARELSLFDPHYYLKQIVKADVQGLYKKPLRRRSSLGFQYFLYLSCAAMTLGLSMWMMIAFFSDLFEPMHHHNLPVWPTTTNTEKAEIVSVKTTTIEMPRAGPKKRERSMGKHGTLFVKVNPWAEVFIDGQFVGSTPMGGVNLPEGQYLVQLRNPGVSAVALKMVKIYADKKTELIYNF